MFYSKDIALQPKRWGGSVRERRINGKERVTRNEYQIQE